MKTGLPHNILSFAKLDTAITHAKKHLTARLKKHGLYENFGQQEARQLYDAYIDISDYSTPMLRKRTAIQAFKNWCMSLTA